MVKKKQPATIGGLFTQRPKPEQKPESKREEVKPSENIKSTKKVSNAKEAKPSARDKRGSPEFEKGIGATISLDITTANILQSVAQMRMWQQRFFQSKSKDDLLEAKKLEAVVDMRLASLSIKAIKP